MATTTTALQPVESAALVSSNASLPSIAEIRQRMTWLAEFRPVLLEYVQRHMDPRRHMYTFENNKYEPLDIERLGTMLAAGKKPALNQDGIHNLMSLYDCYPDEPSIQEMREDGHYTCRATLRLISFRSGLPMGAGTGSCSTRESKYAYRWVYGSNVPSGVDKSILRTRKFKGRDGKDLVQYRLDNDDVADVEATVLQMAVKRAKSAAVKALPLVSEMFSGLGDPDEEKHREDEGRQELLRPVGIWLKSIKGAGSRAKAILAVFGEPLRAEDIAKLDEDRLATAVQVLEIAQRQQVTWDSPTLVEDIKQALRQSAAQAQTDLFGEAAPPAREEAAVSPANETTTSPEVVTGEVLDTAHAEEFYPEEGA